MFPLRILSKSALGRVSNGAESVALVSVDQEIGENALYVVGIVRAVEKLEPGIVEEAVVDLLLVEALLAAAVLAPSKGLGRAPGEQERLERLLPLLVVGSRDALVPFCLSVDCGGESLLKQQQSRR